MSSAKIGAAEIATWLEGEGVGAERAVGAAAELAESWEEGDYEYQTVRDVLGDHLLDDVDPRPKLLADALAEHFNVNLEG